MPARLPAWCVLGVLSTSASAVGCQPFRTCEAVDEAALVALPERLSQTGLFVPGTRTITAEVWSFRPRFELWSDGASKQRWIRLPPGTRIDSGDLDAWQFPVGTKVWKEFTRDGVRVETRLLERLPGGWMGLAYVWQEDQLDATSMPYGAIDALGTGHDVPASNECPACHAGRASFVLGFSAIQLAAPPDAGALNLDELVRLDLVTNVPVATPRVPGNETEQAALGYLHANCSHCHNASRPRRGGARCFDPESRVDFTLRASEGADVADTATYRTASGDCFVKQHPSESKLIDLVGQRGRFRQMPPLATEVVDAAAVALLRRWIEEM
jgi:hypothetical protein